MALSEAGMARMTHAAQINLCFCDATCEFIDFSVGARTCNLARQFLELLRRCGIGKNGETEPVATSVSGRAALPSAVFGPVLARALARLALILRSLVTLHCSLRPISGHR